MRIYVHWCCKTQDKRKQFGFFECGYVSLPVSIIGYIFMDLLGHRWLPSNRGGLLRAARQHASEFLTEFQISKDCPLVGMTIGVAKQKLKVSEGNIVEILREGITPTASLATLSENEGAGMYGTPPLESQRSGFPRHHFFFF